MTAQQAIHELKQVRQYCSARAIPAIDYAIQVLQKTGDKEEKQATKPVTNSNPQ